MGNFDFNGAIGNNLGDPKYDKDAVNLRTLRLFATSITGLTNGAFVVNSLYITGSTISGTTTSQLNIVHPFTPTGSTDSTGIIGDITWDNTGIYLKTPFQWLRITGATF